MKKIVTLVLFIASSVVMAQKTKIESGDFKFLAGVKEVNVEFDYSNLKLMKENLTEEQYVTNRATELNEKKGVGDIWKKKWQGSKEMIWNPKFLELINVVSSKEKTNISFQEGLTSAKYTLIVEVVWIYPGWDVAMMKQPAKVTTNLKIVETANRSNTLVVMSSENAPGDQWGSNFSNETRIGEGFAKTGKTLAKVIAKQIK
ncbi:hypothetical protein B0I03_101115 [Flavobacterium aquaticum]|uniref:DUF4468 domain-containing protein n=1 Tax=Flavobacterium aquaticum TaxID=1236486 RepID=A0A327YUR3_9FLAO|nr:hypothetical protein [Flavobacterium aquaticum]RAK24958.1 hypothetical protein B0I03_101115 [Flavobacterium aquaticum]